MPHTHPGNRAKDSTDTSIDSGHTQRTWNVRGSYFLDFPRHLPPNQIFPAFTSKSECSKCWKGIFISAFCKPIIPEFKSQETWLITQKTSDDFEGWCFQLGHDFKKSFCPNSAHKLNSIAVFTGLRMKCEFEDIRSGLTNSGGETLPRGGIAPLARRRTNL